jgi:hypothetical protein
MYWLILPPLEMREGIERIIASHIWFKYNPVLSYLPSRPSLLCSAVRLVRLLILFSYPTLLTDPQGIMIPIFQPGPPSNCAAFPRIAAARVAGERHRRREVVDIARLRGRLVVARQQENLEEDEEALYGSGGREDRR